MGTVSKPHNITAGELAIGSQVDTNFDVLYAVVNGNIDANNITAGAITNACLSSAAVDANNIIANAVIEAKISDGAVTENKIGTGAVTNTKIGAGAVRQTHMDYSSANSGALVLQVPGYAGTAGTQFCQLAKNVTITSNSGTDIQTFSMIYSDDSQMGNPDFSAAPYGVITMNHGALASTDMPHHVYFQTLASTSCVIGIYLPNAVAASYTANIICNMAGPLSV